MILEEDLEIARAWAEKHRGNGGVRWAFDCGDVAEVCLALLAERDRLEAARFVPGHFECAKCKFYLVSSTLYVNQGTIGPNEKPQDCSNGCGPMWRVSWMDASLKSDRLLEKQFAEIQSLKKRVMELHGETP